MRVLKNMSARNWEVKESILLLCRRGVLFYFTTILICNLNQMLLITSGMYSCARCFDLFIDAYQLNNGVIYNFTGQIDFHKIFVYACRKMEL